MTTTETDTGGTVWDAPNQQVVRADQSAPWEEGTGGAAEVVDPFDAMTKTELLAYADEHDIAADASMNKADIKAAIEAAG